MTLTADVIRTIATSQLTDLRLKRTTQSTMVWGLTALFVLLQVISGFGVPSPGLTIVLYTFLLLSLFVLHGTLAYRLRDILAP